MRPGEFFDSRARASPRRSGRRSTRSRSPAWQAGRRRRRIRCACSGRSRAAVTIAALGLLARRLAGERAGLIAAGDRRALPHPDRRRRRAHDRVALRAAGWRWRCSPPTAPARRAARRPRARASGPCSGLAALTRGEALHAAAAAARAAAAAPRRPAGGGGGLLAFAVVLAPVDGAQLVASSTARCSSPPRAARRWRAPTASRSTTATSIGSWDGVLRPRTPGAATRPRRATRQGDAGVEYALDHAERLPLVAGARVLAHLGRVRPVRSPEGRDRWVTWLGVALYVLLLPLAVYGLVLLRRRGARWPGSSVTPVVGHLTSLRAGLRLGALPPLGRAGDRGARRVALDRGRSDGPVLRSTAGAAPSAQPASEPACAAAPPGCARLRRRRGARLRAARRVVLLRAGAAARAHAVGVGLPLDRRPVGRRAARRRARSFGSNFELVDSSTQSQPWLEYTRERLPAAAAVEPARGAAGARTSPTPSRPCSRRSACPPTCCPSGGRWA